MNTHVHTPCESTVMASVYPSTGENAICDASHQPPKLLDRMRQALRVKHYAYRTEQAYVQWVKRFILYHDKCHPEKMGRNEIETFLTHLAVEGRVSARQTGDTPAPRVDASSPSSVDING
jgi:hypothetical protein